MYKRYTIRDVAKLANVSISTVSRVLNDSGPVKEATRNAVFSALKQLDQKGADPFPSKTPDDSKVILASFPDFRNPFYSNIIKGISDASKLYKSSVIFYLMDNYAFPEAYDSLLKRVDSLAGLIFVHAVPDLDLLKKLTEQVPVVMCSEYNKLDSVSFVTVDDYGATYSALNYLISTKRKKIALFNSSLRNHYATRREEAFRSCLKDHNLDINENWIVHLPEINYEVALVVATEILKQEVTPDAIFCVSDVYAAAAINAAKTLGLSVPGDVSIVGFDNIDISTMTIPSITTVSQPTYMLGFQALNLLVEQIEYPSSPPQRISLGTELVLRDST